MDPDNVAETPEPVRVITGIAVGRAAEDEDEDPSTASGAGGAEAVREGGVDVYTWEAMHSSICLSLSAVSPLGPSGGNSSLQMGHSSSSGICRLGAGGGGAAAAGSVPISSIDLWW